MKFERNPKVNNKYLFGNEPDGSDAREFMLTKVDQRRKQPYYANYHRYFYCFELPTSLAGILEYEILRNNNRLKDLEREAKGREPTAGEQRSYQVTLGRIDAFEYALEKLNETT